MIAPDASDEALGSDDQPMPLDAQGEGPLEDRFRFPSKTRRLFRPRAKRLHRLNTYSTVQQSVDWRSSGRLLPPLNQEECNVCTAVALAATMGDISRLRGSGLPRQLSPAFIHICIGRKSCAEALDPAQALPGVQAQAVPMTAAQENYEQHDCSSARGVVRVADIASLWDQQDGIAALQSGPAFAVMDLYEDFWSGYRSGVYRHPGGGPWLSTHSVELVGYDLAGSYWILKNSRGPTWGEAGYARVAFGECGILTDDGHRAVRLTVQTAAGP